MSWVAVGGAVVAAAGTAYQADQAGDAADAQADSANAARRLTQRQFDQTRNDLMPYRVMGDQAAGRLSRALGLGGADPDMSEFYEDPGYQFRLGEGQKAVDRSAAGRGMLLSGAQLKDSQRYNQGMASQEFGNWFARLQGIADRGQNASVQTGSFGATNAANQGNYLTMGGNAQAQGIANKANAITGGVQDVMGALGSRSSGYANPNNTNPNNGRDFNNAFAGSLRQRSTDNYINGNF